MRHWIPERIGPLRVVRASNPHSGCQDTFHNSLLIRTWNTASSYSPTALSFLCRRYSYSENIIMWDFLPYSSVIFHRETGKKEDYIVSNHFVFLSNLNANRNAGQFYILLTNFKKSFCCNEREQLGLSSSGGVEICWKQFLYVTFLKWNGLIKPYFDNLNWYNMVGPFINNRIVLTGNYITLTCITYHIYINICIPYLQYLHNYVGKGAVNNYKTIWSSKKCTFVSKWSRIHNKNQRSNFSIGHEGNLVSTRFSCWFLDPDEFYVRLYVSAFWVEN